MSQVEGLLLIVPGIIAVLEGWRMTRLKLTVPEAIGPGWYVVFLGILLIICGLWYLLSFAGSKVDVGRGGFSRRILVVVYGLALLAMYAAMVPFVGYLVSTIVFFALTMRLFGEPWIRSLVISIAVGPIFYFGFVYLANINLP
jgi:hypothetical protein